MGRARYVFYWTHQILVTWPKNFVFGQVLFSSACMCLSVRLCVGRLSQKVFDRFWWNLAQWCIIIKYRFLSKMRWIGPVERIPRPFEMLELPYLTKFWGKLSKTSWKSVFYYLVDNFQTLEKYHWLNAYLNKPLGTKVADILIIDFWSYFPLILFLWLLPLFVLFAINKTIP